jgi:hypothetical protein
MLSLGYRTQFSTCHSAHRDPLIEQRCTITGDSLMFSDGAAQGPQTIPMSRPRILRHPLHARHG